MKARLIKIVNLNFALYEIVEPINCRIIDSCGRDTELTKSIIGVAQIDFCGQAGGKTGKHKFADNPEIEVLRIKVQNGKARAKWRLLNQAEIDRLYYQRVAVNI